MFSFQNDILSITRFRKILHLGEDKVTIQFKNQTLTVNGHNLTLVYMESVELRLKGEIRSLEISDV